MAVLVLAVAMIVAPLLALFLNAPLFDYAGELALVVVLGAVGIAIIGSVFAATLLKVRSRDVLLPVILYPLLVPLFVAGTKTTAALVAAHPEPRSGLVLDPASSESTTPRSWYCPCGSSSPW